MGCVMPETLAAQIEVLSGRAFPSDGFNALEGLPLIRIRDLGRGTTEVKFKGGYDPRYVINDGDLLIDMDGDFLVERWAGGAALLNQRVCKVESVSESLDQGFLYWYLMPHVAEVHRKTPQTTVRHLAASSLGGIPAPPISVAEQRAVKSMGSSTPSTPRSARPRRSSRSSSRSSSGCCTTYLPTASTPTVNCARRRAKRPISTRTRRWGGFRTIGLSNS